MRYVQLTNPDDFATLMGVQFRTCAPETIVTWTRGSDMSVSRGKSDPRIWVTADICGEVFVETSFPYDPSQAACPQLKSILDSLRTHGFHAFEGTVSELDKVKVTKVDLSTP